MSLLFSQKDFFIHKFYIILVPFIIFKASIHKDYRIPERYKKRELKTKKIISNKKILKIVINLKNIIKNIDKIISNDTIII